MSFSQNPYYQHLTQTGAGAGGAGGFMLDSPGGSTPDGRKGTLNSLRPVTCKQLLHHVTQEHGDAEFTLDGTELGPVSLVVQVMQAKAQATSTTFTLRDGGGTIEARAWRDHTIEIDMAEEMNLEDGLVDDAWVYVVGTLKHMNNRKHLNIGSIRPVKDYMEVLNHLLEVMTTHLYYTRGPPGSTGGNDVAMHDAGGAPSAYRASVQTPAAPDAYSHLPPLHRSLLNAILAARGPAEGVHVSAIVKGLTGTNSAKDIEEALDQLMDEGHIYSTIDETHYDVSN